MKSMLPQPDSPLWKESPRKDGSDQIRWIPITSALSDDLEVGVDSEGCWVYGTAGGVARADDATKYIALLPILRTPQASVLKTISDALATKSMPVDLANSFPFSKLIVEALRAHGYWSGVAIKGLEQGAALLPEYVAPLKELAADREHTTQHVRHAAARLLHKMGQGKT